MDYPNLLLTQSTLLFGETSLLTLFRQHTSLTFKLSPADGIAIEPKPRHITSGVKQESNASQP